MFYSLMFIKLSQDFTTKVSCYRLFISNYYVNFYYQNYHYQTNMFKRYETSSISSHRPLFYCTSLYHFIQYLHEKNVSFNLISRTYGDDLNRIAQEFNHFCNDSIHNSNYYINQIMMVQQYNNYIRWT